MMKKNSAETISACRRMASLRSRPMTAVMILNIRSILKTQFADGAGRDVDQLVRGHHCQATALQVAGNDAGQPVDRSHIECNEGFIEYPQRALFLDQSGQRDPALLALRQVFAGEVLAAGEADLLQRIDGVIVARKVPRRPGGRRRAGFPAASILP
jgi:hypothetical protein